LSLRPAILLHLALATKVERWSGDVEVALFNQDFHLTEEEGHQQGVDVTTIDIGIGHDNDLMITQLADVELFGVLFRANGNTQRCVHVADFLVFQHFMRHGFFYVENLATKWQNGLELPGAALFGRTTGRVSLNQEKLALGRVFFRTVSQFTWQTSTGKG